MVVEGPFVGEPVLGATVVVVVVVVVLVVVVVDVVVAGACGAGGAGVTPVVAASDVDAAPLPTELMARIRTSYRMPSARPLMVSGDVTSPTAKFVQVVPSNEYA